jgi:hypothetical protein
LQGSRVLSRKPDNQEQQQSYQTMSAAARSTAAGLENIASETEAAGTTMTEFGDFAGGLLKGAAAIASIALAPATGGLSLGLAATSAMGDPTGSGGLY